MGLDALYCVGGTFQRECSEYMARLDAFGLGAWEFQSYLQSWSWPGGYASGKASFNDGELKGDASTMISIAPILGQYIREKVDPLMVLPVESQSCKLLCAVLQKLVIVNSGLVSDSELRDSIMHHLQMHQKCYGHSLFKPKDHWIVHLPDMLRRHGCLISCFLMEHKHRVAKRMMTGHANTTNFDYSILAEITVQHLSDLSNHRLFGVDMLAPHPAPRRTRDAIASVFTVDATGEILTSRSVHVKNRAVLIGDAVSLEVDSAIHFGQVWFHCKLHGSLYSCVSFWRCTAFGSCEARCIVANEPEIVSTSNIIESCMYKEAPLGSETVIFFAQRLRQRASQWNLTAT